MAYTKQTWTDGPDGDTPLSAARLGHIEDGIEAAADTADDAVPASANSVAITRPSTAQVRVTPSGNASNSSSAGGALNVTNTASTGAGLVVYSEQASPSGHLFVARANNATFNQNAVYVEHNGTGHGVTVNHKGTGSSSSALNVASTNTSHSAVGISGVETSKGTLKVTHTGTGTDANASAISVDLAGSGTAAQGIFVDATGGGTTGHLLRLRNNTADKFIVSKDGGPGFYGATPVAKPEVTGSRSDGTALASLLTALETLGLITDSSTT